ncbi:8-amino-7-oxononanoate synthase-like protein [Zopfia rhizophila CBS 207.26]|uniref:8-amino-7-oxononanoate synthase-like protein n=1 Tax=Zopfia rhizophila CBS 207.26 TaxID=1314779 RepID=A0A6A6E7Z5_9PEZI|nr:8-amino-7-oxononanoate synthase-like protein [Zopfia rhizophila CBS 207.26]
MEKEEGQNESSLEAALRKLLERRRANSTLRTLTLVPSTHIDFSSNDFLSLSKSPALHFALLHELQYSNIPLGSGGSRLLDGNSRYAECLEYTIAQFHRAPAGLLFNSGFDANVGFFACVPQPGDVVVYDEFVHASVHDGIRLSRASKTLPFAHNSIDDLRRVLQVCLKSSASLRAGKSHVIITVEAVYSMDGDLAPLKEIVETVETVLRRGCGYVVVDEAHSTGVIGSRGRGLVSELGLEDRVFARLHTFGKALSCNGAIILCSELLRSYLVNYARPLIYTTFMSYPALATIRASYTLLQNGDTEARAQNLKSLIQTLFSHLRSPSRTLTFRTHLQIPSSCPKSPVFSIKTRHPKSLAKFLQERGFVVRAVVPPTVPQGTERVRVCLHAGNTEGQIRDLVDGMEGWAEMMVEREEGAGDKEDERVVVKARL